MALQSLGSNETQLQQSRSQVASCLAKRLDGKSVAMVLMMAGDELDPVFGSLAPVIELTRPLWDGWMPLATMAKCIKAAQTEQRDNECTAMGGRHRTLRRSRCDVQTDAVDCPRARSFLCCTHDSRIVDPRRVCRTTCTTSSNRRRVALHEGYDGLDRGAVFAPLFAALRRPRLGTQE